MNTLIRSRILSAAFILLGLSRLGAQELSLLGGGMTTKGFDPASYTWQMDYSQNFYRGLAASVAYINEGHIEGHHRDGTAFELWARIPLFKDRIAVAAGAGAYYFYDTQPLPNGDTANVHGSSLITSASVTGYFSNRWFARALINRITPTNQVKVTTAAMGLGFWFGREKKPTKGKLGGPPSEYSYVTPSELTVFGGQSVVNTFLSQSALAYAAEFRHGLIRHVDWTASAIYEGDPEIVRRTGIASQVWMVNTFFDHRVSVGAGVGPYIYIDRKHPASGSGQIGGQINPAAVAPLVSLTISTRITEHVTARLMFDRVTSSYNRDADIFLLGIGYQWGERSR